MKFEFTVHPEFNFRDRFAETFDLEVINKHAIIPERLGQGYVKEIITNASSIKLVIHNYRLKEDFHLKPVASAENTDLIYSTTPKPSVLCSG